jgi:hypothetical protein
MTPLVNGEPVPFRHIEPRPGLREQQIRFYKFWIERGKPKGCNPNTARQMWIEILVTCHPGDEITVDEHPDDYEQVWAKIPLVDGNRGNLVISGKYPAQSPGFEI